MNSYDFLSFLAFPSTKTRKLLSFPLIIFFFLSTLVYVWIQRLCLCISLLHVSFFIFYFLFLCTRFTVLGDIEHCSYTIHALFMHCSLTVHALFTHCLWDSQPFYSKKILKMDSTALFTYLKIIFL